jgi:hypothetical protein
MVLGIWLEERHETASKLHLLRDRLADEKKRPEAQLVKLKPSPEREQILMNLRRHETAFQIDKWVKCPELQPPK